MADVLKFADLTPLTPAPITDDSKIIAIERDPATTVKGFKSTNLDYKDYVNAGKAGGKTILGGTGNAENLIFRSTSALGAGFVGVHQTSIFKVNQIEEYTLANGVGIEDLLVTGDDITGNAASITATVGNIDFDAAGDITLQCLGDYTINAGQADADLIISSVGEVNLIFCDMDTNRIGLKTNTPSVFLDIADDTKISAGTFALATGTSVNEIVTTVDVSSTDDQLATAKAVWNAVGVENLWDRVTGTPNYLVPHTAADELGDSSARIIKGYFTDLDMGGDLTFTSGNFSLTTGTDVNEIVTTVDASSTNDQLATAKAVHDSATSVVAKLDEYVATPGQTAFTLSQTPSGTNSFQLFLNGKKQLNAKYSFIGTALTWGNSPVLIAGDTIIAQYDFQAPSLGRLTQAQIYYWSDTGDDANDGKSIDKPKLTIAAALAAAVALIPSATNQFTIYGVGAMDNSETFTIASWCHVHAPQTRFTGAITMNTDSSIDYQEHVCPASGSAITTSTIGLRYIKVNSVTGSTNSIFLNGGQGEIYLYAEHLKCTASGAKIYNLTSSNVHAQIGRFDEAVASTVSGSAVLQQTVLDDPLGRMEFRMNQSDYVFKGDNSASGYTFLGNLGSGYIGIKRKTHSGTMPTTGANLQVTAATLGISDARQITKVWLTAKTLTTDLWIASDNSLGSAFEFDYFIPGTGAGTAGDFYISTGSGATSIAGRPFTLTYEFQRTNYLN